MRDVAPVDCSGDFHHGLLASVHCGHEPDSLSEVSKRFDGRQVLRKVFFRLERGDRVGLIGNNGSGKTTVLRMFLGQDEPTEGQIEVDDGPRLGYFSQFSELSGDRNIEDVLHDLFIHIKTAVRKLRHTEELLSQQPEGDELDQLLKQYETLTAEVELQDGWTNQHRIDTVLSKLGFSDTHRRLPIDQLSGGWRNRAALALTLLSGAPVVLLDEPTNHLDLKSTQVMERALAHFPGAIVVVSHDQFFIDKVANRLMVFGQNGTVELVTGNWTTWSARSVSTGDC